jgi:hypothetical protein
VDISPAHAASRKESQTVDQNSKYHPDDDVVKKTPKKARKTKILIICVVVVILLVILSSLKIEPKPTEEAETTVAKTEEKATISKGSKPLSDKTIDEVRQMVDEWNDGCYKEMTGHNVELSQSHYNYLGLCKFFGEPDEKQLVEEDYYFYYECKDGELQLKLNVYGSRTLNEGRIMIDGVNLY